MGVYENFRAARENLKKVGKMSGYKSDEDHEDKPVKRVKKSKINCRSKRAGPNILVTGTPGTGKSTLCRRLVDGNTLKWINVGDFATQAGCLGEWDERYDCHELDEDKLIDELEDIMAEGNVGVMPFLCYEQVTHNFTIDSSKEITMPRNLKIM